MCFCFPELQRGTAALQLILKKTLPLKQDPILGWRNSETSQPGHSGHWETRIVTLPLNKESPNGLAGKRS